jgi:hypothetical protein
MSPQIIQGNLSLGAQTSSYLSSEHFDYKYPYELDLKPGSKVHEKIKTEVMYRALESHSIISKRIPSWNEIERVVTAYVDISEEEAKVKAGDYRKPVSIVFPYSYVVVETLLTYLVMTLLQNPIFKYEGNSSDDTIGAIMMERVIHRQCDAFKVALALHTFLRDCLVYGLGIGAPVWEKKLGNIIKTDMWETRTFTEGVLFEGNKLNNVDPYLYLPDPRVPSHKVQEGEYVGWVDPTSRMTLLTKEKVSNGDIFNVKYLKNVQFRRSSIFTGDESERGKKAGLSTYPNTNVLVQSPVDTIYMYVNLIPKEWELGTGEYPEKWLFGLANDEIVIQCKKLGLSHNMFPLVTAAPDLDGYSVLPLARTEVLYGLQGVLDFLFNSHIANVRKSINDMLIVDPYQVNIADIKDDKNAGKLIRLRRPAWGKGVKDVVQQLVVQDITRSNIADTSLIIEWMQKIGATDESMMGALRQGGPERLTGQEFQGTRASAATRLERIARIISLQGFHDLAYMFASHTQQLMNEETYVKVAGRYQEELMAIYGNNPKLKVRPQDLLIDFDIEDNDGSMPHGDGEAWTTFYKILAENPNVASGFDMTRIAENIARILGAKNVQDFKIQPKLVPDEVAVREAQKGNIRPMALPPGQMGGQGDIPQLG